MPETIVCPHCGKSLRLRGEMPRHCQCPACGRSFGPEAPDDLGPSEGTYDVDFAKPRRKVTGRECDTCGASMRLDASFCDVCSTRVADEDEPDTPEKQARLRRKERQKLEDQHYRRLDLIVAQVGCALVALIFLGCGLLHISAVVSVGFAFVMGGYFVSYHKGPPEDASPALRRRWEAEKHTVLVQFIVSLFLAAVLVAAFVVVLVRGL